MKRIAILTVTALFAWFAAVAQTDTTRTQTTEEITVTEETADSSDFSLSEKYDYLIRAQVEETSLFKIGIHSLAFITGGNPTVSLAYERKLKPSFSVLAEVKEKIPTSSGWNTYHSVNLGGRYYYNLNKRIRKGKSANNFSANYLGIYQQNQIRRYMEPAYYFEPTTLVVFGMQRRISKYGYVDFFFGPGRKREREREWVGVFQLGFSLGLAF